MNNRNSMLVVLFLSLLILSQVVGAALTATPNPPAATNTVIDVGQSSVINTLITGPSFNSFTYNWFWVAPVTATGLTNGNTIPIFLSNSVPSNVQVTVTPASATTLLLVTGTVTNTLIASNILGVWSFNAVVTDVFGTTNTMATSVRSLTINPAFSLAANTISNVIADVGQTEVLTIAVSGGTSPYVYNFLVTNSQTGNIIAYAVVTNALTTNTFSFTLPTEANVIGTLTFSANVVDSATTKVLTGIGVNTFGANALFSLTKNTISNTTADVGQKETLTIGVSGGTAPYTYNYLVTNAVTSNIIFSSRLSSGSTTNTVSFTLPNDANVMGTLTFTANVVDSATTNGLTAVGVNSMTAKAAPSVVLTSNALVNSGQTQMLTATLGSGGAGSFKVQFFNITGSSTFNTVPGVAISGFTTNAFVIGATTGGYSWNAIVQDVGTTTPFVFNSVPLSFTVNAALSLATKTASNTIADQSQAELLTIGVTGGTSPYTYNFLVANANTGNIIFSYAVSNAMTTNTVSFTLPADANVLGAMIFTANVVDSATLPTNVLGSTSMTGYSQPTITLIAKVGSTATNTLGPNDVNATTNALVTGGKGDFTFQWTLNNANTQNTLVGTTGSSNTLTRAVTSAGTYVFNVIATDTGTTTPYVLAMATNAIVATSGQTGGSSEGGTYQTTTATTTVATTATTTVPQKPTVTFNVSDTNTSTVQAITVSSGTDDKINFPNTGTVVIISTTASSPTSASVTIANVTGSSPAAPSGLNKLVATNISVNSTVLVSLSVTIGYPCSMAASSIAPYKQVSGGWQAINPFSVNAAACTVTFTVASNDPVVALMQIVPTTTTTVTTSLTTSMIPTTSIPQSNYTQNPNLTTTLLVVMVILVLAVVAYWFLISKKGYGTWKKS